MTEDSRPDDFESRLQNLVAEFRSLANGLPVPSPLGSIDERTEDRQLARYRRSVRLAGELLIEMGRSKIVDDSSLDELIVEHDLASPLGEPENLFGILVGGPRIELRLEGRVRTYEKPHAGKPFQWLPYRRRRPSDYAEDLGASPPPDAEQCLRYAEYLTGLCTEMRIPLRALRAGQLWNWVVETCSETSPTDKQVYKHLKAAYDIDHRTMTDEFGELPVFKTWVRYLRDYRRRTGTGKNLRRARSGVTRSVVRRDEI